MPAHYTKTYDFDEEGRHIILRQPQTWEDAMKSACDELADTPALYRNIIATAESYELNRRTLAKRFQRFLQDYPEFEDPLMPYMTTPVYIHDEETYKIVSLGRITDSDRERSSDWFTFDQIPDETKPVADPAQEPVAEFVAQPTLKAASKSKETKRKRITQETKPSTPAIKRYRTRSSAASTPVAIKDASSSPTLRTSVCGEDTSDSNSPQNSDE